ncbi:hypothetical protein PHYSODRAFT_252274 [Phytophthora sojae]|uniref:Uncharacterized protein n=1 Tax=Phytophthora sojae (strain P6497) TaxID=1094619 RepID=G5A6P1_PHYSP|nr:hypothetical protein PHYSODRAFT_252274 [Phytophthora sojae]EGZ08996.1 hypothetical protein PHYSODRAFT_252274 [Phytophthora sojae]|eukprot:XP_009535629.1 hypothetical protein PHYSODRAFT_252274 [Phytophthora sojae]
MIFVISLFPFRASRPRKTVDYLQAAQGYTQDDEGNEDYVEEDEVTPDEEEEIGVEEVEKDNEEAKDTEVDDDEEGTENVEGEGEVKDVEDDEEAKAMGDVEDDEAAKGKEMAGNSAMSAVEPAVGPNEKHDDTTATHMKAKWDGGMAAAVIDDDDLFGSEDKEETANAVEDKDVVAEDNDKGAGSKRQVTAIFTREEAAAEAAVQASSASRAAAAASSTTARKKATARKRKPPPGRSAVGASPPKRAKVGRKEKEQAVITSASDQPPPRHRERRRTETWEEREKMVKAHNTVGNLKPPLARKSFAYWGEFEAALNAYQDANLVLYRVRSSQSKTNHDGLPGVQKLPDHFTHKFKAMWCTHGAKQSSRGEGLRESGQRYTGCEASFTVRSVKTTKTIYESYTRGKSLLLPAAVHKDLGLMAEVQTSTPGINRYLSGKLGGCSW